jgi:2-polyprenyl-6-methoxyphenol hydroxylase-like FAD-dependent oxidoreductase
MVNIPKQTDVFIVGGGSAGLATAIALRSRGFGVTVADPALPPIDKTCGEGLMPDALASLERLGVTLHPRHFFPFRGIRFVNAGASVDASFPNGTGAGIRRTHLHQALIDRAQDAGATLLWGVPVQGLTATGVTLDGGTVECRWVVGADGENSRVRQWAGLEGPGSKSLRFGFRRHYRIAPWTDCVEIYWGSGCQIYVTPIGREEMCVVAMSRDSHLRLDQALPMFPELFGRLKNAASTSTERGAISATRRLARVYRGRVVLVGDASGSVDAITGEGLRLCFDQSLALAQALADDDLDAYAAAHRQLARRPAFMAALMLSLGHSAWLRGRVLRALSSEPRIFASQIAMHVGAASTADFIRRSVLPLGRHILAA